MQTPNNQDYKTKVENILDQVRPYLTADGGGIEFIELTDDLTVKVRLSGTCKTCMIRTQTLRGVESALINEIPEIKGIVDVY